MSIPSTETVYEGFTLEQLEAAFHLVVDQDDWKAPIEQAFPCVELRAVDAAVRFYTATEPTFEVVLVDGRPNGNLLCRAAGYRAGPAGP